MRELKFNNFDHRLNQRADQFNPFSPSWVYIESSDDPVPRKVKRVKAKRKTKKDKSTLKWLTPILFFAFFLVSSYLVESLPPHVIECNEEGTCVRVI